MSEQAYHVEGNHVAKYAIVLENGAVEYDLLDTRTEADEICEVLNCGIGPEWDAVITELEGASQ